MNRIFSILTGIALLLSAFTASAQWTHIRGPVGSITTVRHLPLSDKVFVTGSTKTAYTTDAGRTWTDISNPTSSGIDFLASDGGNRLHTLTAQSSYISPNLGKSWDTSSTGLIKDKYQGIKKTCEFSAGGGILYLGSLYDPNDGGIGILKSTDFGKSWKPALPFTWWFDIYTMGKFGSMMYGFQSGGKIFRWNDNGKFTADTILSPDYKNVTCFSDGGNRMFAGTISGLYLLNNDNKTWTKIFVDTMELWIYDISVRDNMVALATSAGLYLSDDFGNHWSHEAPNILPSELHSVFITSSGIYAGGGLLYIKRTGAINWDSTDYFATSAGLGFIASFDNTIVTQTYSASTYTSNDGFQTFQGQSWPVGGLYKLFKHHNELVSYSTNYGLGFSTDTGKSWQWTDKTGALDSYKSALFVFSGNSLSTSFDDGKNWSEFKGPSSVNFYGLGEIGDSLLLIGNNVLFISTDAGVSWNSAPAIPDINPWLVKSSNNTIFIISSGNTWTVGILSRGSAGVVFPPEIQNKGVSDIATSGSLVAMIAGKTIYYSSDYTHWDSVSSPSDYNYRTIILDSTIYIATINGLWKYKIGTLSVANHNTQESSLSVYPNPISDDKLTISFDLNKRQSVKLDITDALGRIVGSVTEGIYDIGSHSIPYHLTDLPSGAYYLRLRTSDKSVIRTIIKE